MPDGTAEDVETVDQEGMSIELSWCDGESKFLDGVDCFSWGRRGDENLVAVEFVDGSEDKFTGQNLVVVGAWR